MIKSTSPLSTYDIINQYVISQFSGFSVFSQNFRMTSIHFPGSEMWPISITSPSEEALKSLALALGYRARGRNPSAAHMIQIN